MSVNYLTVSVLLLAGASSAGAFPGGSVQPVVAGLLGRPVFPSAFSAPSTAPDVVRQAPPAATSPPFVDDGLPFSLVEASPSPPPVSRAAIKLGPVPAPIAMGALREQAAPAVVALVASAPNTAPQVATGVLLTASGLILTSRRAIASALESGGKLAMAHAGPRGRFGSHELGEAVPARVLEIANELDLALVEALPTEAIFYPHLPVTRRQAAAGATFLALGHGRERGLWSATPVSLATPSGGGTARWFRDVTASAGPLPAPGTPLLDGVGRVVALITEPQPGVSRAIDAEALLRFLSIGQAPARRFGGVPPFRRPSTLLPRAARAGKPASVAPTGAVSGLIQANASDEAMPGVTDKGSLDQHLRAAEARAARRAPALEKAAPGGGAEVSFDGSANVLVATASDLERHPVADVVKVELDDAPERGPKGAWVTIVELGDYHAAETRQAEPAIRALVDGDEAPARLLWKDADRGDGAAYFLAARAARAAGEQESFWSMHDHLLAGKGAKLTRLEDAHRLARALELDVADFDAVLTGDAVLNALETEGEKAGRIPVLATPSFIVNGHVVDGGSVAGAALRAAVDEELALADARAAKQSLDGVAARRCRGIAGGKALAGIAFVPARWTAAVMKSAARHEPAGPGRALHGRTITPPENFPAGQGNSPAANRR